MRIVGGRLRGRVIRAPAGQGTRPTSDRTRETLFNILAHSGLAGPDGRPLPEDCVVLDLFAGSGALGLEALSRGGKRAGLVETEATARAALRHNIEELGLTGITQVLRRDATQLGPLPAPVGGPFDLVLLDPPYSRDLAGRALAAAAEGGWLATGAIIAAEISADEEPPEPAGFQLLQTRRSAKALLTLFRYADKAS